jgi:hypothetical protein
MSKLIGSTLAASLALGTFAGPALSGSIADPLVDAEVIIQQSTSSVSHHVIPPALFVAFVAASIILGPTTAAISDARLKTDIQRVGTAGNGLPLYHFRYVGQSQTYEGVMAQDVLAHTPEAVVDLGGYYGVNYGMLGLEMRAID